MRLPILFGERIDSLPNNYISGPKELEGKFIFQHETGLFNKNILKVHSGCPLKFHEFTKFL
jgi:hypothetical protein